MNRLVDNIVQSVNAQLDPSANTVSVSEVGSCTFSCSSVLNSSGLFEYGVNGDMSMTYGSVEIPLRDTVKYNELEKKIEIKAKPYSRFLVVDIDVYGGSVSTTGKGTCKFSFLVDDGIKPVEFGATTLNLTNRRSHKFSKGTIIIPENVPVSLYYQLIQTGSTTTTPYIHFMNAHFKFA